jgi:hypothetical protein
MTSVNHLYLYCFSIKNDFITVVCCSSCSVVRVPLPLVSLNFWPPPALALAVPAHDFQQVGLIPKPASSLIGGSGFYLLFGVFSIRQPFFCS